ncbi:hypothetical protein SLA_4442 [Streptomyces laurentii]|uniref:Uncharacterized protein n=1 Tax=Streptomyces laurentii TaxID=39478 RepID=A0A160P469_STRLU|nr:hypothetical protein SLA_4442 [Streptomyces laurentii]
MGSNSGENNVPDDVIVLEADQAAGMLEDPQSGARSYLIGAGGLFERKLFASGVNAFSKVFASMTEFAPEDHNKPFLGGAVMTVHNVVPQDGGIVTIRADVGVPNTLNVKVSLFFYNGS